MSEPIVCPSCSATNPPGATWCSLCYHSFAPPEPEPEPPRPAPAPEAGQAPAPTAPPPPPATGGSEGEQLALLDTGDDKSWTCRFCDTNVPIGQTQCPTCQQSIYDSFGGRRPEVELDPTDALRRSILPGGGHFALEQGITAVTILVLTIISLAMGIYLLVVGVTAFGAILTFVGLTLWMLAAHDAFRMASGHTDEIFLKPRVLSVAMGVWFVIVIASVRAAQQVLSQ